MKKNFKYLWATIPEGTEIIVPNPDWDGDRIETWYWIKIRVDQDIHFELPNEEISYEERGRELSYADIVKDNRKRQNESC